jgi:hypothetical protein
MPRKLLFPKFRRPGATFSWEAHVAACERFLKEVDKALELSERPPSSKTSERPSKDKPSD